MTVFNTTMKQMQRSRAAGHPTAGEFDYLRDEVASRLVGRLFDIQRTFPTGLDLGGNSGNVLGQVLGQRAPDRGGFPGGLKTLHVLEPTPGMMERALNTYRQPVEDALDLHVIPQVAPMEGEPLPYDDASMDVVLSSMALHWVNDVPGVLAEVKRVLKPDGVFIGALLGGDTLMELR
jgi:NADH dehydrogenase [ubiquinone] 1 alpha subcomplex assembly factor 5